LGCSDDNFLNGAYLWAVLGTSQTLETGRGRELHRDIHTGGDRERMREGGERGRERERE